MSRYLQLSLALLLGLCVFSCASRNATPDTMDSTAQKPADSSMSEQGESFLGWCRSQLQDAEQAAQNLKQAESCQDARIVLDLFNQIEMNLGDAVNRSGLAQFTNPDAGIRQAGQICEQESMALQTELLLDSRLYDVLGQLKDVKAELDADSQRYLERLLRDYKRNGVDRDEATRQRIRELNKQITELAQTFDRNLAADTRSVDVNDPARLAGLPEDYLASHQPNEQGVIQITTDWPDYYPVMLYADDTELRHQIWMLAMNLGYPQNVDVFKQLLQARYELATLLGYENWAAFSQELLMVKTPENARNFIDRVTEIARPLAENDKQALLEFKRKSQPQAERVFPWERAYLTRQLKQQRFNYSPQDSRPYFPLSAVQNGVLDWSQRLFGVTFTPSKDVQLWHESVQAFDVSLQDEVVGRIYLDLYPRENKYKSFAMFPIVQGVTGKRIAEGAIVGNFPDPTKSADPVLIDHLDVTTFFHEFGHLMHHIMAGRQQYVTFSGTVTEWDFVETPSQLYEEWAWDPTILQTFAKNAQGEAIPAELVTRMQKSDLFAKALFTQQQMYYAALALGLYQQAPEGLDPDAFAKEVERKYSPWQGVDGTHFVEGFGHLVGYSSNYYTYMWSLVIVKDLAELFHEQGLDNTELSLRYRKSILDPGGARDADQLVRDFLGRDFKFDAFKKWLQASIVEKK